MYLYSARARGLLNNTGCSTRESVHLRACVCVLCERESGNARERRKHTVDLEHDVNHGSRVDEVVAQSGLGEGHHYHKVHELHAKVVVIWQPVVAIIRRFHCIHIPHGGQVSQDNIQSLDTLKRHLHLLPSENPLQLLQVNPRHRLHTHLHSELCNSQSSRAENA